MTPTGTSLRGLRLPISDEEAGLSAEAVQVRLEEHHRRLSELERTQPAVMASELREVRADIREINDKLTASTRAQWAVAMAIVVGSLSIAVTAIQIAGG